MLHPLRPLMPEFHCIGEGDRKRFPGISILESLKEIEENSAG